MIPKIIDEVLSIGYKGLVLEGFGAGNVPVLENSLLSSIKGAIDNRIPVVVSTQCAIGCSWMYLYECGRKALKLGAIPGHDMTSETALVKLMWVLGQTSDMEEIRELMLTNVAGETSEARSAKEKRLWE